LIIEQGRVKDISEYSANVIPAHTGIAVFDPEVYSYFRRLVSLEVESSFENAVCPVLAWEKRFFAVNILSECWTPVKDLKGIKKARLALM
jgi:hypothetical protein